MPSEAAAAEGDGNKLSPQEESSVNNPEKPDSNESAEPGNQEGSGPMPTENSQKPFRITDFTPYQLPESPIPGMKAVVEDENGNHRIDRFNKNDEASIRKWKKWWYI